MVVRFVIVVERMMKIDHEILQKKDPVNRLSVIIDE